MEDYQPKDIPLKMLRVMQIPRQMFLFSLIIGTLLLLIFILSGNFAWIGVGIYYVAAAFVVNLLTLAGLVIYAFRHRDHLSILLWNAAILLINLPIACAYYLIVVSFVH